MPRIFFAMHLTEEVRARLADWQRRFPCERGTVRWVRPANLHLTLQFIGDVDRVRLDKLLAEAGEAAAACPVFTVDIDGIGVFPHPGRPRVIWAGIARGNQELARLANVLSDCLQIPPDKPFSPHITLGRVREGRKIDVAPFFHEKADFNGGTMRVSRFSCVESTLTPGGPVYQDIRQFVLAEKK